MKMYKHVHPGYASALVLAVLALATATEAKTVHVDDNGKADFQVLAVAIDFAEDGDVIVIEPGNYGGGNNISGKTLTLRSRDPNDPAVVAGTVINCGGPGGYAIGAEFGGPAGVRTRVTMAGLTIRNGTKGTILCETADLTLINCIFTDATTSWAGGAINCRDSRVRITGCTFSRNVSEAVRGGAIFCSGSRLDLTGCTFDNNKGCAIVNYDSMLNLTDCGFQKNSGEDGGAIHCRRDVPGEVDAGLNLTRCTFLDNSAGGSGGATYCYYVKATGDACAFTSNRSKQDGGAMYSSGSNAALGNCVFVSNSAGTTGGAISAWYGSNPQILNCTFFANNAVTGGAVAANGRSQVLISHSILWSNNAAQGKNLALIPNVYDYGGIASATVEYSDVAGGRNEVYAASGSVLNWSRGNLNADPLFAGPRDRSLKGNSPCIDAGDSSYVPASDAQDLAGNPRRSGPTVDLGAYEAGPSAVYRFWSPLTQRHFYTISRPERDKLINEFASVWTYEGIAFYASTRPFTDMLPIYRFWSPNQLSHFWTIDEKEAQKMIREQSDQWLYEGIGYYAYPPYKQPWGTVPVYRFWWKQRGGHFYTASEEERDKLLKDPTWTYEGAVWYVLAGPHGRPTAVR